MMQEQKASYRDRWSGAADVETQRLGDDSFLRWRAERDAEIGGD